MRYLNMTFLPDPQWTYAFFVWLSNEEGVPFKRLNDQLRDELMARPEWRYIYQKYGYHHKNIVFETDSGEIETNGMLFPLISFYDFFIRDGFNEPLDPTFRYGETFRYFGRIAKGIELLQISHHYYPGLALPDIEGVLYPQARWFLNREPLDVSGLQKQWLHTIPRAALSPRPLATFHIRQWIQILIDEWSDKVLRHKLGDSLPQTNLKLQTNVSHLSEKWLEALVANNGTPFDKVVSPQRKQAYKNLKDQLSIPLRAQQKGQDAVTLYESFQESHLPAFIHPIALNFYLEPLDPDEPFGEESEWAFNLQIEGKKYVNTERVQRYFQYLSIDSGLEDKEREQEIEKEVLDRLPLSFFTLREIKQNHWEAIQWLEGYAPLLKELSLNDWSDSEYVVPSRFVENLLNRMDFLKKYKVGLKFPDWFKWRDYSDSEVSIEANVSSTPSFFSLDAIVNFKWQLSIGDLPITKELFNQMVKEHRRYINYRGEWVSLPLEQLSKAFDRLSFNGIEMKDKGRVSDLLRFSLAETDKKADRTSIHLNVDTLLEHYLERLLSRSESNPNPPDGLRGDLRPYQKLGFGWLVDLSEKGIGGCLADDMGLGKTIQTIAYLLKKKETTDKPRPSLIVCPTSVMGNWESEIEQFAPSLSVMRHHGGGRLNKKELEEALLKTDVVITSYTLSVKDAALLTEVEWASLILDEAQAIKNPASQKSRILKSYQAAHRIALTGTPIENRLEELWSIMDFLNPGYLGSLAAFRRGFINPIEKHRDTGRSDLLKRLIQPFLLRREKTDKQVITDLPDKNEQKVYCHLTEIQASMYQSIVDRLMERVVKAQGMERRGLILSTLTRLKQVCNHPDLVSKEPGLAGESGKMNELFKVLPPIFESNGSVLIFTQYVKMGHLLVNQLETHFPNVPVSFLYGGVEVKKRENMVRRFQATENSSSIFILSLKAGGFGLNLTAANHVIHYDRWWNPAVENQATDRSYRIGQKEDVHVYKMICEGTLEKQIDELLEKKKHLSEQILGRGDGWVTELDDSEVYDLVRLRRKVLG